MTNFDEYLRQSEPHKREKGYAWQTAIPMALIHQLPANRYWFAGS